MLWGIKATLNYMKFVSHGNYAYDRLAYTKHSKYKKSLLYLSRSTTAAPPKYLYTHEPLVQALSSQNIFWSPTVNT